MTTTLVAEAPPARATRTPTALLAAAAVLALAHLPLLIEHGHRLWGKPHYQFFPIVLIGAAILGLPAIRAGAKLLPAIAPRPLSLALFALNWLLLFAALVLDSPWTGTAAFIELLFAVAYTVGGWPLVRLALPALVYLCIVLPPPLGLDYVLVNGLQSLTSRASSRILDYFGVLHLMDGNVVKVGAKRYLVEEACSGINSLLSILACTFFFVLWARTHWLRALGLVGASIFWVLTANITRVVSIVYFDTRFGFDLSKDDYFQHTIFGFVLFGLTLLLLASTDRLLLFVGTSASWLLSRRLGVATPAAPAPVITMAPSVARPRFAAALVAAYAVLLALQGIGYATGVGQARAVDQHVVALCNGFGADTLPTAVGPWRRDPQKSFAARDVPEMMYADHSRSWQFQRGGRTATVSFDYPYFEWHDLAVCYKGTGWTIGERSVFGHALPDQGTELSCTKFTMSRPYERHGYVWFCSFDERGAPVVESNLAEERWSERLGSLKAGLLRLVGSGGLAPSARPQILQVQVVHDTYVPLTEADEKDVQELFLTASGLLRKKFVASLSTLTASR